MKCDRCDLPLDTQYGCTCGPNKSIPTPEIVYIDEDYNSQECIGFESKLTWFLIGCLVTLGVCGLVFP